MAALAPRVGGNDAGPAGGPVDADVQKQVSAAFAALDGAGRRACALAVEVTGVQLGKGALAALKGML